MQKRLLMVGGVAVVAMWLLWPDDEEPPVEVQTSANATITRPQRGGRIPARQTYNHSALPGFSGQNPRTGAYSSQRGYQPTPPNAYSQDPSAPFDGYYFRSPGAIAPAPTPRQVPQYPGSAPPQFSPLAPHSGGYDYATTPGYRFRPQGDDQKSSRRYSGGYPAQGYLPQKTLPHQGTFPPDYGNAPAQSWQAPGYDTVPTYPGATAWDHYSGQ